MGDEWNGKSVLVLGLGDTGRSAIRWLSRRGARVRAADSRESPPALGAVREAHPDVGISLGPFAEALLAGVDAVVASPGLALREPILRSALARGIEVVGDVEIFAREVGRLAPAPVVLGVTGTNGKSTVTALAAAMGTAAGRRSVAAGNIGLPVLDALEQGADFYAVELSSYQLETTSSLALAAATMLNLSQDHLDRYGSMQAYAAAKARIFRHCGTRVLNRDDPWSMSMAGGRTATFGLGTVATDDAWGLDAARERLMHGRRPIAAIDEMPMKGLHNAANALAAHALCVSAGLEEAPLAAALREFEGLPHRVQLVAEARGVRFFDDSKGTNVGASVAALEGFTTPVVLIAGGDGKGQDFAPLAPAVRAHARAVVLIGRDAPRLEHALAATGVRLVREESMEGAVSTAFALAKAGDAVLLSPACASLDMFRNYGHRGQVFAEAARAVAGGSPPATGEGR